LNVLSRAVIFQTFSKPALSVCDRQNTADIFSEKLRLGIETLLAIFFEPDSLESAASLFENEGASQLIINQNVNKGINTAAAIIAR
jgi:hypothetical protein